MAHASPSYFLFYCYTFHLDCKLLEQVELMKRNIRNLEYKKDELDQVNAHIFKRSSEDVLFSAKKPTHCRSYFLIHIRIPTT